MKRFGRIIIIVLTIMVAAVFELAADIKNSKHDLSSSNTSASVTIKSVSPASGGTNEICVFCHTPHGGNTDAPLWNRALYSQPAGYEPYTSDVLSALSYSAAENPYDTTGVNAPIHAKTRICLSCHDGTVALGQVVNLPYGLSGSIPMVGATGDNKMPPNVPGYIGVKMQDDHPVAIVHSYDLDPELKSSLSNDASNVNLYKLEGGRVQKTKSGGTGSYVECTSCHDPHKTDFGKFLVDQNDGSKICITCHQKEGFSPSSAHAASSTGYAPDGGVKGTTVGDVGCMNCHFPHKAGVNDDNKTNPTPGQGKYLLSFKEEQSCFNTNSDRWETNNASSVCHGTVGVKRIKPLLDGTKTYKHPVTEGALEGRHQATEARQQISGGWAGSSIWHVECADCHNPHTAGSVTRSASTTGNDIPADSPLKGVGGVNITSYPTWVMTSTGNYNVPSSLEAAGVTNFASTGAQYEYQICLKCHSDFAWGITPPTVLYNNTSSPSPVISPLTNQAREFGNNSQSSHPVIFTNGNDQGTYILPWNSGALTMYCSDCHGNSNVSEAQGPHGSSYRAILKKQYDPATIGQDVANDLCYACHDAAVYYNNGAIGGSGFNDGSRNLHYLHMNPSGPAFSGGVSKACTRCHVNPPHGINRPHLISLSTASALDPAPYGSYSYITSFFDQLPGSYASNGSNCSAVVCHPGVHP